MEISPRTSTSPVVVAVSQATRAFGSSRMIASRMASEIWSHILSGWPSVTDSDVKRYWAASTMLIGAKPSTGRECHRLPPQAPGPDGLEVEVALDSSQDLVADDPVVA